MNSADDDKAKAKAFAAGMRTFELYARYNETESIRVEDMTHHLIADDGRRVVKDAAAVVVRSRLHRDAANERRSSASGCTLL